MERSRINSQDRFAPAQSRARVFSIFTPARVDEDAGKAARTLGEIAGAGAEYAAAKEIDDAEKDLEQGIVTGMVEDGERIRNGEIGAEESPYFRRGVQIGMARATGLQIGMELQRRREAAQFDPEIPPVPTDTEEYVRWREEQLAEIQQEFGIDPGNLSGSVGREYASALMQARQHDGQRQTAYARRRLTEQALQSVDIEVQSIWQNSETPEDAIEQTAQVISSRYGMGVDSSQLRDTALNAVIAEAVNQTNPDLIRQYIEASSSQNPPLLNAQQRLRAENQFYTLTQRQQQQVVAADRAREEAEETRIDELMNVAASSLADNPYQPIPEDFEGDAELVGRFTRLQNAFISNRDNSFDPVMSTAVLDSIYTTARTSGGGAQARRELDDALVGGLISNDDYARASGQIRSYEENAGELNNPVVRGARSDIILEAGFGTAQGMQAAALERQMRVAFDVLVLDSISEWRRNNPEQSVVPEAALIRMTNSAFTEIMDNPRLQVRREDIRASMRDSSGAFQSQRSALRDIIGGDSSEDEQEPEDGEDGSGVPSFVPGGP